jgi:hypothetical protein
MLVLGARVCAALGSTHEGGVHFKEIIHPTLSYIPRTRGEGVGMVSP